MNQVFALSVATIVTLGFSAVLVTRLERVGARLGFTEALLGLLTALAANAPEITSAVTALLRGQRDIGVGVILGSNVFNLAALLGLGALVAGRISLHRRVVLFAGGVALWIATLSVGAVTTWLPVGVALTLGLAVFIPYVLVSAAHQLPERIGIAPQWSAWLRRAIEQEEQELRVAIHPSRGSAFDAFTAGLALVAVVASSVVLEHSASSLGTKLHWSQAVVGGVVLAGVTSLPNAVAAVYLASRGRGAAVLSEALNSNNLNSLLGFLLPAAIIGLTHPPSATITVAGFYIGMTIVSLIAAYWHRGLGRLAGTLIVAGYACFVLVIVIAH